MTSTSCPQSEDDWRGRFILDMATNISAQPDIELSLWAPGKEFPTGITNVVSPDDYAWLNKLSALGGIAHLLRRRPIHGLSWTFGLLNRLRKLYRVHSEANIIHVNWLQNALPLIGLKRRVVITVLGSDFSLLRLPGMKAALRVSLRDQRVVIAPNAPWMEPELRRAFGDLAKIRSIPFGVDENWFAVQRVPPSSPEWLVVSRITRGKLGTLVSWGEGLFGADRRLHLLGPMQENIRLPDWIEYHGATFPAALLRDWFPRVTGLLTLSTHPEGRPQVLIEAMASGLSVIASDLPAHRDLIQSGNTGWIVDSQASLKAAILDAETPQRNLEVGIAARNQIRTYVGTWQDCAKRFVQSYDYLNRA